MNPFDAVVDRVIDGDTVWVRVRVRTQQSAPSLSTEEGTRAHAHLVAALPQGRRITVIPFAVDQFGRIVARITPQ